MEVIRINPQGYCKGVVNALQIVKRALKDYPNQKIYVIGMIIHNKNVTKALELKGVKSFIDPFLSKDEIIDSISEGVVIFTAHGTPYSIIEKARNKGLIVLDATCIDVTKTQNLILEYLDMGYDVIYLGKKHHPEAEAALSLNPQKIHLVTSLNEAKSLKIHNDKIIITNQTTMSILDLKDIFDALLKIYPSSIVMQETCNATRIRQEALFNLDLDLLYVVGDTYSNNSNNLKNIAFKEGLKALLIESVHDINNSDLVNVKKVGVTSGASTPNYLTQQVIDYLKEYPKVLDSKIDFSKIF